MQELIPVIVCSLFALVIGWVLGEAHGWNRATRWPRKMIVGTAPDILEKARKLMNGNGLSGMPEVGGEVFPKPSVASEVLPSDLEKPNTL